MRLLTRRLTYLSLVSICLLPFQNCSPMHTPLGDASSSSLSSSDVNAQAAKVIQTHCSSCHGGVMNSGGLDHIENTGLLVQNGWVIPGDPANSAFYLSVQQGSMPKSYQLSATDVAVIQQWIIKLIDLYPPTPPPVVTAPTCTLSVDKTSIMAGQSVNVTLKVTGTATSASINGVSVPVVGVTQTLFPAVDTTYMAQVGNSAGANNCSSPQVKVTPVTSPNAPTCILMSSAQNVVPGDPVTLSMMISGSATGATINGTSVTVANPSLSVSPLANTTYSASVSGSGGTSTCSLQVTTKAVANLTRDEFYRAKVGPNGQSVDSLISVGHCNNCHKANPPANYSLAAQFYKLAPGQTAQNLAAIKNIVGPNDPTKKWDLTRSPPLAGFQAGNLYTFASGHKKAQPAPYGYSFTAAELSHIQKYVTMP